MFREETKRYRQERNIFRVKYEAFKDHCSCGVKDKIRNGESGICEGFLPQVGGCGLAVLWPQQFPSCIERIALKNRG